MTPLQPVDPDTVVLSPTEIESRLSEHRALLGKLADVEVAQRAGVTRGDVRRYRRSLGIPVPPVPSNQLDSPVDSAPGARTGSTALGGRRQGASRPGRRSAIDAVAHLLGTMTDRELAEKIGVNATAVKEYRRRRGLPSFSAQNAGRPPSVGRVEAMDAATGPSAPSATPSTRRGGRRSPIDAYAHLVGVLSDGDVARRIGTTTNAVFAWRTRRGIPAYAPTEPHGDGDDGSLTETTADDARTAARSRSRLDEHRDLFGYLSDREVANRVGMTQGAVFAYRKKHGIPPYQARSGGHVAEPAPAPAPAAHANPAPVAPKPQPQSQREPTAHRSTAGAARLFVVVVRRSDVETTYGVVADDVAEAARIAVAAVPDGDVVSLTRDMLALR